jgi:hypothetical protein
MMRHTSPLLGNRGIAARMAAMAPISIGLISLTGWALNIRALSSFTNVVAQAGLSWTAMNRLPS